MIGRVSTNGTIRTYHGHLGRSTWNQQQAMNTVLTGRRFNQFSDDPALATQSFRAHSSFEAVVTQRNSNESIVKKLESGSSSMHELSSLFAQAKEAALRGMNEPTAAGRKAVGEVLSGIADNMVKTLNAKYGDKYVFAGADGMNAPFELKDIPVLDGAGDPVLDGEGNPVTERKLFYRDRQVDTATVLDAAGVRDPNNPDNQRLDQLEAMTKETTYVDVGLGFELDVNGNVIPSTAFNSAISGIGLMGYGMMKGEDGTEGIVPNNLISVINEFGAMFERSNDDGDNFDAMKPKADLLLEGLEKSFSNFNTNWSEVETRAQFLKSNDSRLEDTQYTLQEQYEGLDLVNPAEAISIFSYAQYAYNAALRIGNQVLSQSFIDYMN